MCGEDIAAVPAQNLACAGCFPSSRPAGRRDQGQLVYYFMCMSVLPASLSVHHVYAMSVKAGDPLGLQLTVVSYDVGTYN